MDRKLPEARLQLQEIIKEIFKALVSESKELLESELARARRLWVDEPDTLRIRSSETSVANNEHEDSEAEEDDTRFLLCDVCFEDIVEGDDFVFTCLQCPDVHLCKICFFNGHHSHHYVVRIPKDQPAEEVKKVVSGLRVQFISEAKSTNQEQEVEEQELVRSEPAPDEEEAISVKIERDAEADPLQSHVVPGSSNLGRIKCEETYSELEGSSVSIKVESEMYEVEVDEESIRRVGEPHTVQHHGTCKTYSHKKRGLSDDGAEAGPSSKLKCYSGTLVKVEPLSAEESSGDSRVRDAASKEPDDYTIH